MNNEELQKSFTVLTVTREDLTGSGYPEKVVKKIDDGSMNYIAGKMGDALMEGYWDALKTIVDDYLEAHPKG